MPYALYASRPPFYEFFSFGAILTSFAHMHSTDSIHAVLLLARG